jgi:4-hydroxybenzoate polyprenyltransferase
VAARVGGLVRLVHPFPSLLDGLVVAAVAVVAGASIAPDALVLGLSMTLLQFAIGALNDLHDAPTDGGRVPAKPIPSGLVSADQARVVVAGAAVGGLALAATHGTGLLVLAGLVLVIGFGYDLVAKGTAWSWLPFALGIPILPVYGWFGATGQVPAWALALVPAAACAGAALAVANARADVERDTANGVVTIATRLGDSGTRMALILAWAGAAAIALAWLIGGRADPASIVAVLLSCLIIVLGVAFGWRGTAERREWAWRIQAVGAAVAAVTWLAATVTLS